MAPLSSKQQVRIQSDGLGSSTIVTDMEGNRIPDVVGLDISVEPESYVQVTLIVYGAVLDVHGQVDERTMRCRFCGHEETHDCSVPF